MNLPWLCENRMRWYVTVLCALKPSQLLFAQRYTEMQEHMSFVFVFPVNKISCNYLLRLRQQAKQRKSSWIISYGWPSHWVVT